MRSRKRSSPPVSPESTPVRLERLQKVLAAAGVASRRECEELISAGRVEVDRKVVTELGARVDIKRQEVRLDGELLRAKRPVHYLVHKPVGVVSTHRDPARRTRVIDLVGGDERLFTVGRLDLDSSGLILVTNDGELANRLAHPRYEVPKLYRVLVAGMPSQEVIAELRKGIHLAEGKVKPRQVVVRRAAERSTLLEMVLTEGRNREIRRMMARVGHKVLQLTRIGFGPLRLGDLPSGAFRPLSHEEVTSLRVRPTAVRPLRANPQATRATKGAKDGGGGSRGITKRSRTTKTPHDLASPRNPGTKQGVVIGGSPAKKPGRKPQGKPHAKTSSASRRPKRAKR